MSLRTLLTALLLTASFTAAADTEVVNLSHRTSADLLPVAQNFLRQGRHRQRLRQSTDRQCRPRQDPGPAHPALATGHTGQAPAESPSNTNENNQQSSGDSQTRIISYGTASRDGGIQQIQASEGVPALIQVGQSVPLTTTQPDAYGRPQNQTQYRNVTQGFYVTASVTGDTVHLAISTNRDRMSQERPDVVNVQSTDTTVSGRLGEWIPLAGINRETQADKSSTTRTYATQGRET